MRVYKARNKNAELGELNQSVVWLSMVDNITRQVKLCQGIYEKCQTVLREHTAYY